MKNVNKSKKPITSVTAAKANKPEILARGAEAVIYKQDDRIIKERLSKSYRHPTLDQQLRKLRTRHEAKLLQKLPGVAPAVHTVDEHSMIIAMDYFDGPLLRDYLAPLSPSKQQDLMHSVGEVIGTVHAQHIIHGDLTTSNMLFFEKAVRIIDFGLGYVSERFEDKAVDLHLLKKALLSSHTAIAEACFTAVLAGYRKTYADAPSVLQQLEKVEQRGRYKRKQLAFG